MRRGILTCAAVLMLMAPMTAGAVRFAGQHLPKRYAHDAARWHVPTVSGTVTLELPKDENACSGDFGCAWPRRVVLVGDYDEFIFAHEMGHEFDFLTLTHRERKAFRRIIHDSRGWRFDGGRQYRYEAPIERFADAYAWCALFTHRELRESTYGTAAGLSGRQQVATCNLISQSRASRTTRSR